MAEVDWGAIARGGLSAYLDGSNEPTNTGNQPQNRTEQQPPDAQHPTMPQPVNIGGIVMDRTTLMLTGAVLVGLVIYGMNR